MKLYIPQQSAAAKDSMQSHPRKVKKWLNSLPHSSMGELTRQIYTGINELNQQTMPYKHRMENMEMLRAPMREIFDNLKKYFINRTLPLPEKSKKIVNLNQSLLQEMATGYKIIISNAANDIDKKPDKKTLSIAICRAIRYLSELLLRSNEIYAETPAACWYDLHQMYLYAENHKLHKIKVADIEHINKKTTIEDCYKQILLFSLARPTAMRQSDTERVYNKLLEWSTQTNLGNDPQENQVNRFFCARMDRDLQPSYLTLQDCNSETEIRTLETSKLVDTIRKQISTFEKTGTITVGEELSQETLKVLATSWGVCAKRRFSRAESQGRIEASVGLANITKRIKEGGKPPTVEEVKSKNTRTPQFSLESIPDNMRVEGGNPASSHHEIGSTDNNNWDMVAKGRLMTDAFERENHPLIQESLKLNKEDADLHWEIANISAGGYCLRWNSETTSSAQIGELIALHEHEPGGGYEWRAGVIRWMQFTRDHGLEIGVQILSPKVIGTQVQRAHRLNEEPFDCLMLPGIRPLKQPPSILMPAHAFKSGDKLKTNVFEQEMDIVLGEIGEHTGSFTQFNFANSEDITRAQKDAKKKSAKKNNFDEIWSSL